MIRIAVIINSLNESEFVEELDQMRALKRLRRAAAIVKKKSIQGLHDMQHSRIQRHKTRNR